MSCTKLNFILCFLAQKNNSIIIAMKNIVFIIVLFSGFIGSICAQKLSYRELIQLDKDNEGTLGICLYQISKSYYDTYLQYTTDIDALFNFDNVDNPCVTLYKSVLENNKESFHLTVTVKGLKIKYRKRLIAFFPNTMGIAKTTTSSEGRNLVRTFDSVGVYFYDKSLNDSILNERRKIYNIYLRQNYKPLVFKDSNYIEAYNRPIVVIYQYDLEHGLSLHPSFVDECVFPSNGYTDTLSKIAEKYCKERHLKTLYFSGWIMTKE